MRLSQVLMVFCTVFGSDSITIGMAATRICETALRGAAGRPATGTIQIAAVTPFTAASGVWVTGQQDPVTIRNGAFCATLEPNDTGSPVTQYAVTWQIDDARAKTERWYVRTVAGTVRVAAVQANPVADTIVTQGVAGPTGPQGPQGPQGPAGQSPVASVFGRTGAIAAASGDYSASQVGLGNVSNDSQVKRSEMGAAGGVATLDVNGKLTIGQLPAVAITNTYVVASEQAQLALSCQLGDMVIRTDQTKSYINNGGTTGTMADWVWIEAPDLVQSINGQTGNVIWPLPCIVVTGDPGAYSAPLSDDNDSPAACANTYGVNLYVKWVACMADQGTPTVDVRLTGGASVISAPIPCGSTATAGTISGTPMIHPVGADGATCATAPCSLDVDIVAAGGLAKYLVVRVGLATQ